MNLQVHPYHFQTAMANTVLNRRVTEGQKKKKQLEVVLPSQLIQAVSLSHEISQKRMPGMTGQAFMYGVGS